MRSDLGESVARPRSAESTTDQAPGPRDWFVGIATLLFRFPFVGEYLALVNARPVTQSVSDELLAAGRSMALQPGGLPEQIVTDHRREQLVGAPRGVEHRFRRTETWKVTFK